MKERKTQSTSPIGRHRTGTSSRKDQRIRIAWFYYIEGLTQNEIAKRVGLSRPLVNQILAACRAEGLIQVRLNSSAASCAQLAARLIRKFDLRDAVVMPTPAHIENLPRTIGLEAGFYLGDQLDHDTKVAIGWGRTLRQSLQGIERHNLRDAAVVSMLGGLVHYAEVSPYETATRLADMLSARCYYMAAPVYADDEKSCRTFFRQPALHDVLARVRSADIALCSVGQVDSQTTLYRLGLISDADLAVLRDRGAAGELLGQYMDAEGNVIDCDLNSRVIATPLADLRNIPRVVLASGGVAKVQALAAALRGRYANVLITDEKTAELVCQQ